MNMKYFFTNYYFSKFLIVISLYVYVIHTHTNMYVCFCGYLSKKKLQMKYLNEL